MNHQVDSNELLLKNTRLKEHETRIGERTRELEEANQKLKEEVYRNRKLAQELKTAEFELKVVNTELLSRNQELEKAKARTSRYVLEAKNVKQIKGDFLTKMAHEFRKPLNGIMNTSSLLLDASLDEDQTNLVNTIRGSSDALLATISDILDFSKIESGNLTVENIRFDLRETIESALDLVAENAQSKNLELIADLDLDLPKFILGDPFRLRQIILNLMGNSIKFTHHGEVRMSVSQMDATHSQHRIRFEVHDSGIGVDQETQKCLFQPFTQPDTSASHQIRGTGLGLAICRNLVDLMKGSIGVTSEPGAGSTFWMVLPFGATHHSLKKETFNLRPINHLSPLIVHSNSNARKALEYAMEKFGLKAESNDCLESALERIRQSRLQSPRFNLIILDAGNGSWNDFSEISQFRKSEFARNIPILLLIPFSKFPQKEEARRLGIYGSVTKPVKPRHLHNALCSIFGSLKTSTIQAQKRKEHHRMEEIPPKASSAVEKTEEARILLAEDNKVNQRFATLILRKFGYEIDTTETGRTTFEAVQKKSYDLILMDCHMPEGDGYETTKKFVIGRSKKVGMPSRLLPSRRMPWRKTKMHV